MLDDRRRHGNHKTIDVQTSFLLSIWKDRNIAIFITSCYVFSFKSLCLLRKDVYKRQYKSCPIGWTHMIKVMIQATTLPIKCCGVSACTTASICMLNMVVKIVTESPVTDRMIYLIMGDWPIAIPNPIRQLQAVQRKSGTYAVWGVSFLSKSTVSNPVSYTHLVTALENLGFVYVTLDLKGFRSGSMDVGLNVWKFFDIK